MSGLQTWGIPPIPSRQKMAVLVGGSVATEWRNCVAASGYSAKRVLRNRISVGEQRKLYPRKAHPETEVNWFQIDRSARFALIPFLTLLPFFALVALVERICENGDPRAVQSKQRRSPSSNLIALSSAKRSS